MPNIVKGYAVWTVRDERGMDDTLVGYFTDQSLAKEAAKGKGYFGDGNVRDVWIYDVDGSEMYALVQREKIQPNVDLVDKQDKIRVLAKRKLLSALTEDELAALGLDTDEL